MIKQISFIAIAIAVGAATLWIPAINGANAALKVTAPQPILSAGHDQILRGAGGIILKAGADSITLPLQQQALKEAAAK
jgi:hypothetical protein